MLDAVQMLLLSLLFRVDVVLFVNATGRALPGAGNLPAVPHGAWHMQICCGRRWGPRSRSVFQKPMRSKWVPVVLPVLWPAVHWVILVLL